MIIRILFILIVSCVCLGHASSDKNDLEASDSVIRNMQFPLPNTDRRGGNTGKGQSNYGQSGQRQVSANFLQQSSNNFVAGPSPGIFTDNPVNIVAEASNNNLAQRQNMPQIIGIDVQCGKQAMRVRLKFNVPFFGVVYAKGHYKNPDCRYVHVGSGKAAYEFTVQLDRCGTTFTDNYKSVGGGGQAYLENTIIVQMEAGIQEVWDAARRIRCLWNGLFQKTVSSRLNIDMLDIVSITYSGDAVDTYMDIKIGQGPNAAPASGLVKIGETLTVVVYVLGSNDLDVQVRECYAFSSDRSYSIQLTDNNGCVIKKKLMGQWLTSKQTGNSGASILSYAFLQAFKFPDTMDVNLECNVIICKNKCQNRCGYGNQNDARSKREVEVDLDERTGNSSSPAVTLVRTIRVLSQDDIPISVNGNDSAISLKTTIRHPISNDICLSTPNFIIALVVIMLIMAVSCILTALLCLRIRAMPTSSKLTSSQRNLTSSPTPLFTSSTSKA